MVKGNELILDLEKKLNLYSNHNEKEVNYFGSTKCKELVDIVFSIYENRNVLREIELFNSKYNEDLIIEDNKIKYGRPNNFSKIGIEIFERLYFKFPRNKVLKSWLQMTKLFNNNCYWYWLNELPKIEEVKEYFLDEIAQYIFEKKDIKENWIKRFENYAINKPSYYRAFDISNIPKNFDDIFHIYKYFKENECEDFLYNTFYEDNIMIVDNSNIKLKESFIQCLIEHEIDRSYYYNEKAYLRINKLLTELKDDYSVIGIVLTSGNVRFNTYLLSNSEYCLYGFLNIVTKNIHFNGLLNEYEFNYMNQWLEMLANQTVNIFISSLVNNDINKITQIVFDTLNYLVQIYFQPRSELSSFSLEKFLNKISTLVLKNDKLLFNLIIDNLVKKQLKLLEENIAIKKESYFILNWYLKNLNIREKLDDIDYSILKESITNSILQNLKINFEKSIKNKSFYINNNQLINNVGLENFYMVSKENIKDSWANLLEIEKLKNDIKTDDRNYASSLGKFYLEILIFIYSKTYDERLEKTIINIVLKLGIEEHLGIFFSTNEYKLYDSFLKILNSFKNSNYQIFINGVFETNDIKNLLQIYNQTISSDRKYQLKEKIEKFELNEDEFHNYVDLQSSINYALNSGFNNLSNNLIKIYENVLEEDKKESLKREKLRASKQSLNDKDDNTIRIRIDSSDILNEKIYTFKQFKYRKDLVDIYQEKDKTVEEKLSQINTLQKPKIDVENYKNREINIELENYKKFVTSLIFLEEKPLVSYEILKELNHNKPTSEYLINMLRAYYEAYKDNKDNKDNKEKFKYITDEYKKFEKKIDKYEKELYEYQILLTIYSSINNFESFIDLWNELPQAYSFDLYLTEIKCEFLQKNNQFKEALEYLEELKKYHKNFTKDDECTIIELEKNIKEKITIIPKENISTKIILEKPLRLDKYEAKTYWNEIKSMDNETHAHIFGNKENVADYIKDVMVNISEVLLERKINLERVNKNNNLEYEDIINDWVESLLEQRKLFLGWNVSGQSRGGVSGSTEGIGERDLVVKNVKNKNLFLFEAFKNKIEEHLNKLDGYNASGCKVIIVFVYTKEKNFPNYSRKYQEKISNMNYEGFDEIALPLNIEKIESESTRIHLYKDVREKNKVNTLVYHYLLDFN